MDVRTATNGVKNGRGWWVGLLSLLALAATMGCNDRIDVLSESVTFRFMTTYDDGVIGTSCKKNPLFANSKEGDFGKACVIPFAKNRVFVLHSLSCTNKVPATVYIDTDDAHLELHLVNAPTNSSSGAVGNFSFGPGLPLKQLDISTSGTSCTITGDLLTFPIMDEYADCSIDKDVVVFLRYGGVLTAETIEPFCTAMAGKSHADMKSLVQSEGPRIWGSDDWDVLMKGFVQKKK